MIHLPTGELTIHEEDFILNGPIPFRWTRNYFSHIERDTLMGKTWHLNYDQAVTIDLEADSFFWTNDNGNELEIPYLEPDDEAVITSEKIRYRHDPGKVLIEDYENALFYHYASVCNTENCYRLTKITRHRFRIQFFYTPSGRLQRIIDSGNRILHIERDDQQRIIAVKQIHDTQPDKTLVRYAYDEEGHLSVVYDAMDQEAAYLYAHGLLTRKTDRNGNTQHWEYDNKKAYPKCIARWYNKRKHYSESFSYQKGKTLVTDAEGNTTTHYFKNNEITQITDPLGNNEYWEYNIDGWVMRYTDKAGGHTYYGYDDYGNQTAICRPQLPTPNSLASVSLVR